MSEELEVDGLSMWELVERSEKELEEHGEIRLKARAPHLYTGQYNGSLQKAASGQTFQLTHLKTWMDLAEVCRARLVMESIDETDLILKLERLEVERSWHKDHPEGSEKYGVDSDYAQVQKNHDPHFVKDYLEALERCQLKEGQAVLNLGVNRGDEFELFYQHPKFRELSLKLMGIDYSSSAISVAKQRFGTEHKTEFYCRDIGALGFEATDQFDVLISINTLHGSHFDGKTIFREVFQNHMHQKKGAVILGFPNCRYIDGEVVYGGKMKNYSRHDFSLLLKDLEYYKKYLQTHKKRVFVTGKYTLFLTAIPI